MTRHFIVVIVAVGCVNAHMSAATQATLHDRAKGLAVGAHLNLNLEYMVPAADLAQLVATADLVVAGTSESADATVTQGDTWVETVYSIRLSRVFSDRTRAAVTPS